MRPTKTLPSMTISSKKQTGVLKTHGDNARVVRDLQEGDKSLKKLSKLSNFRVTHPGKLNVSN